MIQEKNCIGISICLLNSKKICLFSHGLYVRCSKTVCDLCFAGFNKLTSCRGFCGLLDKNILVLIILPSASVSVITLENYGISCSLGDHVRTGSSVVSFVEPFCVILKCSI